MANLNLLSSHDTKCYEFPQTRYQGSKLKLSTWLEEIFVQLDFNNSLDAFGGTGAISYILKKIGKEVHYNDILKFNWIIGQALIENDNEVITEDDFKKILLKSNIKYKNTISKNFSGIYYLDSENEWLDVIIQNIDKVDNKYKKAGFYWALFQACISKRPYNLFHRKNLDIRTREVSRTFGNKVTWDRPFHEHFFKFINQFNKAIFNNYQNNYAFNRDVFDLPTSYDLVYIDTPYIPQKGSLTNYHEFYHFLEGICHYDIWEEMIDYKSKHRKIVTPYNIWCDKNKIKDAFNELFFKFKKSILVISYRNDGVPSIDEMLKIVKNLGKKVRVETQSYKYVLSNNKTSQEVLIIAE